MKQINRNSYSYEIQNEGKGPIASLRITSSSSDAFSSKVIEALDIRKEDHLNYIRIFEKVITKGHKRLNSQGVVEFGQLEEVRYSEQLDDIEIKNILSFIYTNKTVSSAFGEYLQHTNKMDFVESKEDNSKIIPETVEDYNESCDFLGFEELEETVSNPNVDSKINVFYCKQSQDSSNGQFEKIIKVMVEGKWKIVYDCLYDSKDGKPVIDVEFSKLLDERLVAGISSFINNNEAAAQEFNQFLEYKQDSKVRKLQRKMQY